MATTKTRRSSSSTNVVVLGGGMVGSVIASDLAASRGLKVTVVDARPEALKRCAARASKKIATVEADLGDPEEVARQVHGADLVVGALSSAIGLQTLEAVIDAGRDYVDISFMPEDNRHL